MFFKNKLERLLERICVIVLCVITAVMAIPVKSVTAAGSASVVLEILHEGDTVNVKLEMVSNPGIAGMSFKLCYDSSLLSIVSVDETLDSFKSSIINHNGDGFVGYAYAQAKDCKDMGTVFSITGVLMCIISAALGIYTAKLDKLHLQLIENGTKVKGLVEKVYLQK